ncbi:MAG TPA: hypothetical protein VF702_00090 [Allosphingosinicella sp.]
MNRLSPLIVRRSRALVVAQAAPLASAMAQAAPAISEDLRLFATNFLGGLAFFGTYLA